MKRYLPALIFASVSVIGLAMSAASWFSVDQANRIGFAAKAEEALRRIDDRINAHMLLIRSTSSFFSANGGVPDRASFRRYIEGLRVTDDFAGVQGIGFARLIPANAAASMAVADEIEAGYGVRVEPWPETDQARRTPIVLLEPDNERNKAALGYDMFSNAVRRAAMEKALETGTMQATGRVDLVQEISRDKQAGFLIYMPLSAKSPEASEARPLGFVYSPFRAGDLFSAALDHAPILPVHVIVQDETAAGDTLMYRSAVEPDDRFSDYAVNDTLLIAGREWSITIQPSAAYRPTIDQSRTFALGIVSLLLAAALALSTLAQQRAIDAVETLQRETEKNLNERDFLLQEMKHRIKNMIARVMAMARQTARNSESIDQFTKSYTARLEAMAASQDLLARSSWTSAGLRALLVQELRQVFGEELDEDRLTGPEIQLNETAAQAFGLTFHELATNAMKYGFIRAENGRLSVDWKIRKQQGHGGWLELEWLETATGMMGSETAAAPGVRKGGFGSRLIDATMRIELGGEIERDRADGRWLVRIHVPLEKAAAKDQPLPRSRRIRSSRAPVA